MKLIRDTSLRVADFIISVSPYPSTSREFIRSNSMTILFNLTVTPNADSKYLRDYQQQAAIGMLYALSFMGKAGAVSEVVSFLHDHEFFLQLLYVMSNQVSTQLTLMTGEVHQSSTPLPGSLSSESLSSSSHSHSQSSSNVRKSRSRHVRKDPNLIKTSQTDLHNLKQHQRSSSGRLPSNTDNTGSIGSSNPSGSGAAMGGPSSSSSNSNSSATSSSHHHPARLRLHNRTPSGNQFGDSANKAAQGGNNNNMALAVDAPPFSADVLVSVMEIIVKLLGASCADSPVLLDQMEDGNAYKTMIEIAIWLRELVSVEERPELESDTDTVDGGSSSAAPLLLSVSRPSPGPASPASSPSEMSKRAAIMARVLRKKRCMCQLSFSSLLSFCFNDVFLLFSRTPSFPISFCSSPPLHHTPLTDAVLIPLPLPHIHTSIHPPQQHVNV